MILETKGGNPSNLTWYNDRLFNLNNFRNFAKSAQSVHPTSGIYKLTYKLILDVDFLSYYQIMLQRLQLYQCDKQLIAKNLTLAKFNNAKSSRIEHIMLLSSTVVLLNISLPKWENTIDYNKWISKFESISKFELIVEEAINKL